MTDSVEQARMADGACDGDLEGGRAAMVQCASADATRGEASMLGNLLETLEHWGTERETLAGGIDTGLPRRGEWPELPALHGFTALWTRLHSDAQLRRALAPAPEDTGPLNSRALVHRMLTLMQEQSPGYLQHFTAYVDMLASLQALQAGALPASAEAPSTGRKRARARSRS